MTTCIKYYKALCVHGVSVYTIYIRDEIVNLRRCVTRAKAYY